MNWSAHTLALVGAKGECRKSYIELRPGPQLHLRKTNIVRARHGCTRGSTPCMEDASHQCYLVPSGPSSLTMAFSWCRFSIPKIWQRRFYPLRSQEDLPALIASVSFLHEPARRKDSLLETEPLHFPPETFVVSLLQLPYHLSSACTTCCRSSRMHESRGEYYEENSISMVFQ